MDKIGGIATGTSACQSQVSCPIDFVTEELDKLHAWVDLLVPFKGLHRYLPALFKQANLRITEMPVNHRERAQGTSKYTNWNRALRGIYDLFGVRWLLNRTVLC